MKNTALPAAKAAWRTAICSLLVMSFVYSQPTGPTTKKNVRLILPATLRASGDRSIRNDQLSGYEEDGRFIPHGAVLLKHPNGVNAIQGRYEKGLPVGFWKTLYPNGRLESEATYSDGVPNGIARRYWPDGKLARDDHFVRGERTSSKVYSKTGRLEREHRRKGGRVVYAFKHTKKGDMLADYYRNIIFLNGLNLKAKKICRLRDNEGYRCKRPYQIWRDLNTFIDADQVMDILDDINSKYDDLGLDQSKEVLTQCGGKWVATSLNNTGPVAQPASKFRVRMTVPEMDSIMSGCQAAQRNRLTGGIGGGAAGGRGEDPYDKAVQQTKQTMQGAIDSCNARQQSNSEKWVGVSGEAGGGLASWETQSTASDMIHVGRVTADQIKFDEDGWTPWTTDTAPLPNAFLKRTESRTAQNMPDGTYKKQTRTQNFGGRDYMGQMVREEEKTTDGTLYVREYDANGATFTEKAYKNGQLIRETRYTKDASGLWTIVDKDLTKGTQTTYFCNVEDECTTDNNHRDQPIPGATPVPAGSPEPAPAPTGGAPAPSPGGSPASSAGIPCQECPSHDCAAMASWWANISAMCDQNNWQTYYCMRIVAFMNGCPDPALILPDPNGDLTCRPKTKWTLEEAREAQCKRRKMFEGDYLDSDRSCKRPKLDEGIRDGDICNDPRAQCLPDQFISDGELDDGRPIGNPQDRGIPPPRP